MREGRGHRTIDSILNGNWISGQQAEFVERTIDYGIHCHNAKERYDGTKVDIKDRAS